MRTFLISLVAAAMLPFGAAAEAHPSVQPWCGGDWAAAGRCSFGFEGLPLRVDATVEGSEAPTHVVAWIERRAPWLLPVPPPALPEPPDPVPFGAVLLACAGAGKGRASCTGTIPTEHLTVGGGLKHGETLVCRVWGNGSGTFSCSSGLFIR